MPPEIITCEQNSDLWYRSRAGIPTASCFSTVLAKGRGEGNSVTRRKLLLKLAGEIITGEPAPRWTSAVMERGHEMEAEARRYYAFVTDADPQLVGFVRNGRAGASPDAFIGENGILEIKTNEPHILAEIILKDEFPPEHRAQTQGQLMVCEREWVDLICYWPGMPTFIKRARRDEQYITSLRTSIDQFNCELDDIVAKLRVYGGVPAVAPAKAPVPELEDDANEIETDGFNAFKEGIPRAHVEELYHYLRPRKLWLSGWDKAKKLAETAEAAA